MKLLLCKNVEHLGIVGDIVDVKPGYGRNCLLPQGLATSPTSSNVRRLAEARKVAEKERAEMRTQLERLCESLADVEVTIHAKANEDGVLYGSVGQAEIAAALEEEGHFVKPGKILLETPIRHLDNLVVDIRLADDLRGQVKVWVVREKVEGEEEDSLESAEAGTEAAEHGDGAGE